MKYLKRFESGEWIPSDDDDTYLAKLRREQIEKTKGLPGPVSNKEFDETYKIVSEQLFYELDDRFRIDPGVFFPIKLKLEERSGKYDLTIALAGGWIRRMSDDDIEWLSDRVTDMNNEYSKSDNFYAAFMGDGGGNGRIVFEMMNEDFPRSSMDYMNHPQGPYPDRS